MHPLSQFKFCPKCGSDKFIENNTKSKKCEKCGFVYYFNSCAATVAVIINENKELLVATRAHEPVKGTLDLPGGFVDLHETGEEAMSREVKEETGLDVDGIEYLFSVPNIYIYSGFEVHTLDLVYLCKVKDTHILKAEDDVAKLEFIKVSELNPDLFGLLSIKEVIEKIQKMTI
jgi:mutator protein MutT